MVFASWVRAAQKDIIDGRKVECGVSFDQRTQGDGGKIIGANVRKRAIVAANRRANGIANKGLHHHVAKRARTMRWHSSQTGPSGQPKGGRRAVALHTTVRLSFTR